MKLTGDEADVGDAWCEGSDPDIRVVGDVPRPILRVPVIEAAPRRTHRLAMTTQEYRLRNPEAAVIVIATAIVFVIVSVLAFFITR